MVMRKYNAGGQLLYGSFEDNAGVYYGFTYAALAYFYMFDDGIGCIHQQGVAFLMLYICHVMIQVVISISAAAYFFSFCFFSVLSAAAKLQGCHYSNGFYGADTFGAG